MGIDVSVSVEVGVRVEVSVEVGVSVEIRVGVRVEVSVSSWSSTLLLKLVFDVGIEVLLKVSGEAVIEAVFKLTF